MVPTRWISEYRINTELRAETQNENSKYTELAKINFLTSSSTFYSRVKAFPMYCAPHTKFLLVNNSLLFEVQSFQQ
jgi:hypothetical protein